MSKKGVLLGAAGAGGGPTIIAISHQESPRISVYQWTNAAGWGTKYANPTTLPTHNLGGGITIHPAGNAIAVSGGSGSTPRISAYPFNPVTGFGAKYSDPSSSTGDRNLYDCEFNRAGNVIGTGGGYDASTASNIYFFQWNSSTGFGTKFSDPATLPGGTSGDVWQLDFNHNDTAVAFFHGSSPYVSVYPWNNSTGFGTKYANPAVLPSGTSRGGKFTPDGSAIVLGHNDGAYTSAYQFNVSTGFGTKYSNPATIVVAEPEKCAFNPTGTAFGSARNSAMPILVYAWNNTTGYGTKYADPAAGNYKAVQSWGINWSVDGAVLAIGHDGDSGNFPVTVWPWSDSTGYGTRYSDASSPIPQKVWDLQFYTY